MDNKRQKKLLLAFLQFVKHYRINGRIDLYDYKLFLDELYEGKLAPPEDEIKYLDNLYKSLNHTAQLNRTIKAIKLAKFKIRETINKIEDKGEV